MGWTENSAEWNVFIEAPAPEDMDRLIEHLGLVWFDPDHPPHQAPLEAALDHPGITCYNFLRLRISHCTYQPHLRHLRDLPVQYAALGPELFRVIVDPRQPPAPEAT
jgi:hypothetical protein